MCCGQRAGFLRPSGNGIPIGYFCWRHRANGDQPIPDSYVTTRVTLKLEVTFNGTSFRPTAAKTEALERMRLAVERELGVMSILQLSATFGRFAPPASPGGGSGDGGGGQ